MHLEQVFHVVCHLEDHIPHEGRVGLERSLCRTEIEKTPHAATTKKFTSFADGRPRYNINSVVDLMFSSMEEGESRGGGQEGGAIYE